MTDLPSEDDILFDIETPLGFRVRTTVGYWHIITTVKHPTILGNHLAYDNWHSLVPGQVPLYTFCRIPVTDMLKM